MPETTLIADVVPSDGPLHVGHLYKRADLHSRFGGSENAGIVPSRKEPVILLFHTKEKVQQFYQDDYDPAEGVYRYSGQGTFGDMEWNSANLAVKNHNEDGRDLYFFERAQRKDGLWRLYGVMQCTGYKIERRNDKNGVSRDAIVFSLMLISDTAASNSEFPSTIDGSKRLDSGDLRKAALECQKTPKEKRLSTREVYERSLTIKAYALNRSAGRCESCLEAAPFITVAGRPYLEVHHIKRLADEGLERVDRVARNLSQLS